MGARHEKWGCPVGLSPLLGVQLGLSIGITWYNDYDGNHPLSWDKPPFSITTDQLITGTAPPTKGRKRLRRPAKLCSASCESFPQPAGFGSKSTAIPTTLGMLQHGAGGPMNQMWISKWFQPWDHFIHWMNYNDQALLSLGELSPNVLISGKWTKWTTYNLSRFHWCWRWQAPGAILSHHRGLQHLR